MGVIAGCWEVDGVTLLIDACLHPCSSLQVLLLGDPAVLENLLLEGTIRQVDEDPSCLDAPRVLGRSSGAVPNGDGCSNQRNGPEDRPAQKRTHF